jgi:hypothetical protein
MSKPNKEIDNWQFGYQAGVKEVKMTVMTVFSDWINEFRNFGRPTSDLTALFNIIMKVIDEK